MKTSIRAYLSNACKQLVSIAFRDSDADVETTELQRLRSEILRRKSDRVDKTQKEVLWWPNTMRVTTVPSPNKNAVPLAGVCSLVDVPFRSDSIAVYDYVSIDADTQCSDRFRIHVWRNSASIEINRQSYVHVGRYFSGYAVMHRSSRGMDDQKVSESCRMAIDEFDALLLRGHKSRRPTEAMGILVREARAVKP